MTAKCAYCRQEFDAIGTGPKDHNWIDCGERMGRNARRFKTALEAIAREQSSPSAALMADQFQQVAWDALAQSE